jgi:hypothetical protein
MLIHEKHVREPKELGSLVGIGRQIGEHRRSRGSSKSCRKRGDLQADLETKPEHGGRVDTS